MTSLSKTKIKQTLASCGFDPRNDVLMRPVVENIEQLPDYAVMKAVEILRSYQTAYATSDDVQRSQLEQAIQLLAIRLAMFDAPKENKGSKRSRSDNSRKDN